MLIADKLFSKKWAVVTHDQLSEKWDEIEHLKENLVDIEECPTRITQMLNDIQNLISKVMWDDEIVEKANDQLWNDHKETVAMITENFTKNKYVYDRSTGRYYEVKRELKPKDFLKIEELKEQGKEMVEILNDMKLLK